MQTQDKKIQKAKIIVFQEYGHCDYLNIHTKEYLDLVTKESSETLYI